MLLPTSSDLCFVLCCVSYTSTFSTIKVQPFLIAGTAIKYMHRLVALLLLPAKNRFKQMYPVKGSQGILATSTPKKQEDNESVEMGQATKEIIDAVATFSRPPPLPPVIGPLFALSLLETWWDCGTDDDGK